MGSRVRNVRYVSDVPGSLKNRLPKKKKKKKNFAQGGEPGTDWKFVSYGNLISIDIIGRKFHKETLFREEFFHFGHRREQNEDHLQGISLLTSVIPT